MVQTRLYRALLAAALVVAPAVVATPAQAAGNPQPQVITFTSEAPTDAVWTHTSNLGDYLPTATSTSGLPVQLSVDPANTACGGFPGVIGDPDSAAAGRITVRWGRPGICTIWA